MARGPKGDFAVLGFVTVTQAHFGFSQCWQTEGRFSEGALGLCEPVTRQTASFQAKSESMADKKSGNGCAEKGECHADSFCVLWL